MSTQEDGRTEPAAIRLKPYRMSEAAEIIGIPYTSLRDAVRRGKFHTLRLENRSHTSPLHWTGFERCNSLKG
jgi:hypothetical protein